MLTECSGGEIWLKISKTANPYQAYVLLREGCQRNLFRRQPRRSQRPQRGHPQMRLARFALHVRAAGGQQGFGLCRVFEYRPGAEPGIRVFRKLFSELLQTLCDVSNVIAVGQRREQV